MAEKLLNYVNGEWRESAAATYLKVPTPATNEVLATVPLSPVDEVDAAARLALTPRFTAGFGSSWESRRPRR